MASSAGGVAKPLLTGLQAESQCLLLVESGHPAPGASIFLEAEQTIQFRYASNEPFFHCLSLAFGQAGSLSAGNIMQRPSEILPVGSELAFGEILQVRR
jgi:hypothetical protein